MHLPYARAIPTLEPPWRGVHLMWTGPAQFLFAPGGWTVERRPATAPTSESCFEVAQALLARLRSRLELRLPLGWLRLTPGAWIAPEPGPCEVFTLELDQPTVGVSGRYRGRHGLAIGLQRGKAVGYQFLPFATDSRRFDFGPALIDRVVVYGLGADAVRFCIAMPGHWSGSAIAKLHLPLREFSPSLADEAGELAEAERRLAPGESIDPVRFRELADLLRVALRGPGPRPIDSLLRMRSESDDPEQMPALDPLRTFIASPKWRRVVGLGWLDRDPALVPGTAYDYRITGMFPISERDARVFGFHTIPPGTAIPADFSLGDLRLRLSEPTTVEAAPSIPASGERWTTRAGIALSPVGTLPWFGLGIGDFSAVFDLPAPVTRLVLELDAGHDLEFAAAAAPGLPFGTAQPVPPGGRPLLEFAGPVAQVGLRGKGFLFAVRLPGLDIDRMIPVSTLLAGVRFDETARPEAPLDARIDNLQAPGGTPTPGRIRKLHALGFDVRWTPAPAAGLPFWPAELTCPAPLDATMFQVERRIEPDGAFGPVLAGDNTMFGSRGEPEPDRTILPGTDLMAVFPEEPEPRRGTDEFSYPDVFRAPVETDPARRAPPPPGTVLRYRVRTVDVIGRPSAGWRESNAARLEKHEPPPPPAAYDAAPADVRTTPGPTGVYASVLVRGSAELTPEETALLGDSDNAIVLRWGWRAPERAADPFARHFRVYLSPTFDTVPGEILSMSDAGLTPGEWRLEVRVSRAIDANAAAGLFLQAGYPFFIVEHTAGEVVQMLVRTRIPLAGGTFRQPVVGPVPVPLKLAPAMTRPVFWAERFVFPSGQAQLPISTAEQYEAVIRDRLVLTADHPRDALWVGVTSADAETYVDDDFPAPGPDGPLPGNESPVVALLCQGRRVVRPEFTPPPPAAAVPRVLTPEPAGAPVRVVLDLAPFLPGALLVPGELTHPERVSVASLYGSLDVIEGRLVARVVERRDPSEADQPLTLPNPGDHAAAVEAVSAGSSAALEDRLAVQLAAMHPYADRLFRSATPAPIPFAPFEQTLPAAEERYLYRIRRADVGGRVSAAAAVASVVLRVPSLTPGPVPRRAPRRPEDAPGRIRLAVPRDPTIDHVVLFEHTPQQGPAPEPARAGQAELLRVPNRRELGPGAALRLRLPDGTVLGSSARPLGAPPAGTEGWELTVDAAGAAGRDTMIWAATLTTDGIPSPLGGPWRLSLPKADLVAPVLAVSGTGATLQFSWTLSEPLVTSVWLEATRDGIWERASSTRRPAETSLALRRPAESREYRLVGAAQDGRRIPSNTVVA